MTATDTPETTATGLPVVRTDEATDAAMEAWATAEPEARRETLPQADAWARMTQIANRIARSPLIPPAIRNGPDPEGNVLVILLAAHDLGLSATVAMQKIHVIEGKPSMSAELMRMLIRRDGHDIWSEVERDPQGRPTAVTWFGVRHDHPERVHDGRFDLADAAAAELLAKAVWKKHPEDMLSARATSRLARKAFEDCLAGVSYTPEELGLIVSETEPAPSASDEERAALLAEIDRVGPEILAEVRQRWKAARFGTLRQTEHEDLLAAQDVDAAWVLLRAIVRETPEDAVVVSGAETEGEAVSGGTAEKPSPSAGEGGHQAENSVEGLGAPLMPDTATRPPSPESVEGDGGAVSVGRGGNSDDADAAPASPSPSAPPCTADADETPVGVAVPAYYGRPSETVALGPDGLDGIAGLARGREVFPPAEGQAAGNPSGPPVATLESITADVQALDTVGLTDALLAAKLSVAGAPKVRRQRLIDHRLSEPF